MKRLLPKNSGESRETRQTCLSGGTEGPRLIAYTKNHSMMKNRNFEVIIIGGSYAGLSAAMVLGRSLRNVLIIDSGVPCNRQTPHSHNFLTQDGRTPQEISALGKSQVEQYETVEFYNGRAINATKLSDGFEVTTHTQEKFTAKKLILATGITDVMPDIPGFEECWGISVIHCPYCHGFEFRHRNTAIMANGSKAFHLAPMINNLTKKMTILTNGEPDFNAEQMETFNKYNIKIISTPITRIEHENGQVKSLFFNDGNTLAFDVIYAVVPFTQHSDIPLSLGCEMTEHGYLKVDDVQKTSVEGVFACGDNSGKMRSIANAVHGGNFTGAMINSLLSGSEF